MTAEQKKSLEERMEALEVKAAAQDKKLDEILQLKLMQPAEFIAQLVKDTVCKQLQSVVEKMDDKQAESIVLRGLKSLGKELVLLPIEIGRGVYLGVKDLFTKKPVSVETAAPVVEPTVEPAKA